MPLIQLHNVEKVLGDRLLFDQLELSIEKGERVGLIGNNGEGKTTLFRMIVGEQQPDAGQISLSRGTRVGYLKQDPSFESGNTVLDEAEKAFARLHELSQQLRELEHRMAEPGEVDLDKLLVRYETLQHKFDQEGGYDWQHRLQATLLGVGLEKELWSVRVDHLSGGQRSRLALAQILISEPDLLLLDEPTNHLDLQAIEWLEEYLTSFSGAVLLISHDRYLLDRLATRIVWLTGRRLKSYPGNFSAFLEQQAIQELSQARAYELQQKDIAKQQEFIRRFSAGQRAREAQGRQKKLDRLLKSDAMIQAVQHRRSMRVRFENDTRAGDQLLRVNGLSKSFDGRVLWKDLSFKVKPGERIGIIGPNGSGKTTLLKTLLGQIDADDGEIRWGTNLKIGYYDQKLDDFDPDNSILEQVHDGLIPEKQVRDILGSLMFSDSDVDKRMGDLSGGERARVALAQLMLEQPNVILLDEPTNHLDIQSSEALEKTLSSFNGTLLIVSHDRYFLKKIAKRLLILDPPGMEDFDGGFEQWHDRYHERLREQMVRSSFKKDTTVKHSRSSSEKIKNRSEQISRKDNPYLRPFGRLSVSELETQITQTESELMQLQESLAESYKDPGRVKKLNQQIEQSQNRLKQLEEEYFLREA